MPRETEKLIVLSGSKSQRWDIIKTDINIEDDIKAEIAADVTAIISSVVDASFISDGYFGHAAVRCDQHGDSFWTVRVTKMAINAPFESVGDAMCPKFADKDAPCLSVDWTPPLNMKLTLVMNITGCYHISNQWLVARDPSLRMWKLPISNLYEDCRLCPGSASTSADTAMGSLKMGLTQFIKSQWNSDLYDPSNESLMSGTRNLFRFKPLNDGFEQLPIIGDWENSCVKIGNTALEESIV